MVTIRSMIVAGAAVALAAGLRGAWGDETSRGLVCVAPFRAVPPGSDTRATNPRGPRAGSVFSINLDNGKTIELREGDGGRFDGLRSDTAHVLAFRLDGKRTESFRFTFSRYESDSLCLWYYDAYGTWQLEALGFSRRCRECQQSRSGESAQSAGQDSCETGDVPREE